MRWLDNCKVGNKLALNLILTIVGMLLISVTVLTLMYGQLMAERKAKLRASVDIVVGYATILQGHVSEGRMTSEAARDTFITALKSLRFDNGNYFALHTLDTGVFLAMAGRPNLVGEVAPLQSKSNSKVFGVKEAAMSARCFPSRGPIRRST